MKPEHKSPELGASKLPGIGTTIFTVMSQLAAEHGAINLGQGFPDFDCSPELQQRVAQAMARGCNQYPPMTGAPQLRRVIADKVEQLQGHRYDPDAEITVTAGATQAILTAVLAVVRPGDEVIQLEPAYDSYAPSVALAGGTVVPVPLDAQRGYRVNWDRVAAAITPRTRALFLNSPHNPTGSIFTREDLDALARIVGNRDIFLICDEVYEHIIFDGQPHLSIASSPVLAERAFVISSFGKTFHCTGWKVGYCSAPAPLSREFRKVHQFNVFTVNHPMQVALAEQLQDAASYLSLPDFYQAKRDRFLAGLQKTRFRALPCPGTYFVLADYSSISDETENAFAQRLVREHGVAAIPVSAFYQEPFENLVVRFCFGKREDTLDEGLARLARI